MSDEQIKDENLMEHEYDGIKELDNDLPPWWKSLFILTIIYSTVYFLGYQLFGWYDQPEQEYAAEVKYWEKIQSEQDAHSSELTPANAAAEIAEGKVLFEKNCFVCHGMDGAGTVGPNLTDKYWIYGGSVEDITKIVSKGAPSDKGMQAWDTQLGKSGVRKVVAFVLSLQGTTPATPKAKEGELYDPSGGASFNIALTDQDSLQAGADLYEQYCSACHATDLSGSFAKSLLDDEWKNGKGSFAEISKAIKDGDLSAQMPAWSSYLDDEQIQKIASFLVDKRKHK